MPAVWILQHGSTFAVFQTAILHQPTHISSCNAYNMELTTDEFCLTSSSDKRIFSSPKHWDLLWGSSNILHNMYHKLLPGDKMVVASIWLPHLVLAPRLKCAEFICPFPLRQIHLYIYLKAMKILVMSHNFYWIWNFVPGSNSIQHT
jgi:hypothetical protein